jgi:hypothetical protein
MMYLWPSNVSMEGMHKNFGVIMNPRNYALKYGVKEGRWWALDNDCYNGGFDADAYFKKIEQLNPYMDKCLFLVCPDVVGNAKATLFLWNTWKSDIKEYGPIAFVAQDGIEHTAIPYDFDWMFIGGTTEFKMGEVAKDCIRGAHAMGKPVHVGRVNSIGRFRYFQKLGVDSVDGTSPLFGPQKLARRRWTNAVAQLPFRYLISSSNSSS